MRAAKFRSAALPPRNCRRPIDCTSPSLCNRRMIANVWSLEPSSTQTIESVERLLPQRPHAFLGGVLLVMAGEQDPDRKNRRERAVGLAVASLHIIL